VPGALSLRPGVLSCKLRLFTAGRVNKYKLRHVVRLFEFEYKNEDILQKTKSNIVEHVSGTFAPG
jgi:hypothetical protein